MLSNWLNWHNWNECFEIWVFIRRFKTIDLNLDKTWTIQLKVDEEEVAVEPHSVVRQLKKN